MYLLFGEKKRLTAIAGMKWKEFLELFCVLLDKVLISI
jgi:hypothetical protein